MLSVEEQVCGILIVVQHHESCENMDPTTKNEGIDTRKIMLLFTWSIAHGIRQPMSLRSPKMTGKVVLNAGAA